MTTRRIFSPFRLCRSSYIVYRLCKEMCQFFKKRGYPDSAVTTGKYRGQEIEREIALQSNVRERRNQHNSIHLTYHPRNLAVKKCYSQKLQNSPQWSRNLTFPLPLLILFKRDKNIGNFLVRSAFKYDNQPGTFKCTRTRCKTCRFISNMVKISGPYRSVKITDHFTCISAKCQLLHNLHTHDVRRPTLAKQGEDWRTAFANTYEM